MSLAGDLLSLLVSLSQEIGIVVGVGALTVTLAGHLLSLHAHKNETVFGYVRAARSLRAMALMVIIISGGAATLIHFQEGTPGVMMAPAYIFKWLLIILLTAFYFVELKVDGIKRDAVEGFEGANWYALLIVHTMAPVVGWLLLLSIYAGWVATFGVIWAGFVWIMRQNSTLYHKPGRGPNPFPAPAALPKQMPMPPVAAPVLAPMPAASKPVPVPAVPVAVAAPIVPKPVLEVHPNHSMLPMIAELDLPAPKAAPAVVPPVSPAVPAPKPQASVHIVPESSRPAIEMPNLEESGLVALHVMPKRPEDIESSKRGPVVKMSDE